MGSSTTPTISLASTSCSDPTPSRYASPPVLRKVEPKTPPPTEDDEDDVGAELFRVDVRRKTRGLSALADDFGGEALEIDLVADAAAG